MKSQADLQYAGFWRRFGAGWLDVIFLLPLVFLNLWGIKHFRLFQAYYFLPGLLFWLFYSIYLVKRFGGTPGKIVAGLRITKVDGRSIGYREAVLRELPSYLLSTAGSLGLVFAALKMSDSEYLSLARTERLTRLTALAPNWYQPLQIAQTIWIWGEFIVLLTNEKRRAIHDFIAGTVVIIRKADQPAQTTQGRHPTCGAT